MAGTLATVRRAGMPDSGVPTEIDASVKIRWVDDLLVNMSARSADLLKYLGGPARFQFNNTKIEWVEDDLWNRRPKLGSGTVLEATTDPGTLDLAAGTNHRHPVGTVLLNVNTGEYVRIESHDSGGAVVTVRRDLTSVSTAAWLASHEVIVASFSMNETDAWVARPTPIFNLPFNYAQAMHMAIDVTYRRMETALYGLRGTDLDKLSADAVAEIFVAIEQGAVHGPRSAGATNIPAMFGGLKNYITAANGAQVTDLTGAPLTRKDIDDMLENLFYEVGADRMAHTLLVSSWAQRKITSFFSAAERLTTGATEAGVAISRFHTDWGPVDVMLQTALAKNEMLFINRENNRLGHHGTRGKPHLEAPIATDGSGQTGPFLRRTVYADLSMICSGVQGQGRIHTFSIAA